jgi:hypothetical protein
MVWLLREGSGDSTPHEAPAEQRYGTRKQFIPFSSEKPSESEA